MTTERILDRILSEEARSHNPGARLVEIILWWPKGWNPETKAEYDMKFKEAMTYIYDKGFLGGVAIPHPFRANAAGKKLGVVKQLTTWKAIREEENEWLYYYTSHHLHLIGFVGFMKPPKKGEGFGYEMVMRDGHVVDFLRKSKWRSGLRPVIRYFLKISLLKFSSSSLPKTSLYERHNRWCNGYDRFAMLKFIKWLHPAKRRRPGTVISWQSLLTVFEKGENNKIHNHKCP